MDIDSRELEGKATDEIVSVLVEHVAKSDAELEQERDEGKPSTTELKIFVAENHGFELGSLEREIEDLARSSESPKRVLEFLKEHKFREELLNEEVSYVEIHTPNFNRMDQFIFVDDGEYLQALTVERRDWTRQTVEKLLRYLPNLERLFLSSEALRDIVDGLPGTEISGFTAKYRSYQSDKSVTIQFHGGTESDLETVEEEFGAKPTRLEFDQRNSPTAAVHSSVDREGYYKVTSVRRGSEERGLQTLEQIFHDYGAHDREHFNVEHAPTKSPLNEGFTLDGFTTLHLVEQTADGEGHRDLAETLEERILATKRQYVYSTWNPGNFLVFDRENNEPFEIGVEGSDLFLYAKPGTSSVAFRDFCNLVLEEFNTSFALDKTSRPLRV